MSGQPAGVVVNDGNPPIESSFPFPGDGICPTISQFSETKRLSYDLWTSLISDARNDPSFPSTSECLVDLLRQVPAFRTEHAESFLIHDKLIPCVQYLLEWTTTTDPTCEQPKKWTSHYLVLGVQRPVAYDFLGASEPCPHWPGIELDRARYMSSLIFAWAYILCSRWVETLQEFGEKVTMRQSEDIDINNFWEVVTGQKWQAVLVRSDKSFFPPWSLTRHGADSCVQLREVLPDSLSAFNILMDFYVAEDMAEECAAALVIVLMLPAYPHRLIKIPHIVPPRKTGPSQSQQDNCHKRLFHCIDSCITLSCAEEGIRSLLCSLFFEPKAPCNLVGAQLSGVKSAIQSINSSSQTAALLMAKRSPKIYPLWVAAIWIDGASKVFAYTIKGLPPINIPVASWTDTLQSFIQARYPSTTSRAGFVSRAREYSTSYFVNPEFVLPHTASPPFGETTISNVNLEVRAHLEHDHRPIQCSTYWMLAGGKKLAALQGQKVPQFEYRLSSKNQTADTKKCTFNEKCDQADNISCNATLNLINWHKRNEGGLWLAGDEYDDDDDKIRKLQSHSWIEIVDSDEEHESTDEESDGKWQPKKPV